MGNRGGGIIERDANPDSDGTEDRFRVFFVIFVDFDPLETNDVYRGKADLEIPVSIFYGTMDTF